MRIGVLYPTRGCGEDDFETLARTVSQKIEIEFAYTAWGKHVDRVDDLDEFGKLRAARQLGELERLQDAGERLREFRPDVVTWACSSCSFLGGYAGAHRQAWMLADQHGVPAGSTSLAFVAALRALGVTKVALGSVYGNEITGALAGFLAAAGTETVHRVCMDAGSDRVLATWDIERLTDLVDRSDAVTAEAVVVPETALRTAPHLDVLEARAGKPVLTATQVTIWHALRQAGCRGALAGLGSLAAA